MQRTLTCLLAAGLGLNATVNAAAQVPANRLAATGTVVTALLVGDSDDFLDSGFGLEGSFSIRPLPGPYLWLRADLGYLDLSEGQDALTGGSVDNNMLNLLVGPELAYPVWRLEPFARGYVGLAVNVLSVSGGAGSSAVDETDTVFAWGAGLGLRGRLSSGVAPISLELSGRFIDTGELESRARRRRAWVATSRCSCWGWASGSVYLELSFS